MDFPLGYQQGNFNNDALLCHTRYFWISLGHHPGTFKNAVVIITVIITSPLADSGVFPCDITMEIHNAIVYYYQLAEGGFLL